MKSMNNFAAQQLTKMQMNQVTGGLLACLYINANKEASILYIQDGEKDIAKDQAEGAGGTLNCVHA